MSAFLPLATIERTLLEVRFVPLPDSCTAAGGIDESISMRIARVLERNEGPDRKRPALVVSRVCSWVVVGARDCGCIASDDAAEHRGHSSQHDAPPGFRRHLLPPAVRTAKAGLDRIPLPPRKCINPREAIPAGDECCDRLATARIICRESKSRAQHLCQEVLAEDRVERYGSFLSIRLRGRKGATLIKLFDRVGRGILLTHTGRTFLSEARAALARVRTIKPVLDR